MNADEPAKEQSTVPGPQSAHPAEKEPSPPPADDLPDDVELTPEVVEDEAVRNDFMLRLAVVLLAVLVACTEIGETGTLVHVKAGQYMADHGILPPRTDVFSHAAAEKPWINLSWLFDLFAAAGFALGGAVTLTVLKAVLAGVTFFLLLRAAKRDVPTWWASVCAGLALIVCAGQFTFQPQLITLLGMATTLWLVMRWQKANEPASLWGLVPVFILWCNMDPRAYLGLVVLMLIALGELAGMFLGRSLVDEDSKRSHLWLVVPICLLAFLVNPFGWHSLLSPANLYGAEYPAWRELLENAARGSLRSYLPLTDPAFWQNLTLPVITALVLAVIVPIMFALNWRNVAPAHVLLYLGMVGIGVANSYDLAAVSLVFAVLATLNAQEWYAESFRQSYSVELSERIFSVGGRAVTALAFFGLAFLAITGRLLDNQGNRLGFGFRQDLAYHIQEIENDLKQTEIPGNALNFSIQQGDVLIWTGHKPFIDTRLDLYTRGGSDSLFREYRDLTETWLSPQRQEEETDDSLNQRIRERLELRAEKLQEYEIAHAIAPLGPRMASSYYSQFLALFSDPDGWYLVRLGPMAGWFYHLPSDQEPDMEYLKKHGMGFTKLAFKTEAEEDELEADPVFATAPTWTDELFSLEKFHATTPDGLLAAHYKTLLLNRLLPLETLIQLRQAGQIGILRNYVLQKTSMGYLALRHAQEALKQDPKSIVAYRALGASSLQLGQLEDQIPQITGGITQTDFDRQFFQLQDLYNRAIQDDPKNRVLQLDAVQLFQQYRRFAFAVQDHRYYQAVAAYNQAAIANPGNPSLHLELAQLYERFRRIDLAIREYDLFLETREPPPEDNEEAQEATERLLRRKKDLETHVEQVQKNVDQFLSNKIPPQDLARYAHESGCVLMAIKLLREDGELPQSNPIAQIWQLEAGQVQDAYLGLLHIDSQMESQIKNAPVNQFGISPNPNVRHWIALGALAVGDYDTAIKQWTRQAEEVQQQAMLGMLGTLPLVNRPLDPAPLFLRIQDRAGFASWSAGAFLTGAVRRDLGLTSSMPMEVSLPLLNAALCQIEVGRPEEATKLFKRLLEIDPQTRYRPLVVFYLGLLTDESYELLPPSEYIPVWEDMFAPGPAVAEKPQSKKDDAKPEEPKQDEKD